MVDEGEVIKDIVDEVLHAHDNKVEDSRVVVSDVIDNVHDNVTENEIEINEAEDINKAITRSVKSAKDIQTNLPQRKHTKIQEGAHQAPNKHSPTISNNPQSIEAPYYLLEPESHSPTQTRSTTHIWSASSHSPTQSRSPTISSPSQLRLQTGEVSPTEDHLRAHAKRRWVDSVAPISPRSPRAIKPDLSSSTDKDKKENKQVSSIDKFVLDELQGATSSPTTTVLTPSMRRIMSSITLNSGSMCDNCDKETASASCGECKESYCRTCDILLHQSAKKKHHQRLSVNTAKQNGAAGSPLCENCEECMATVTCEQCEEKMCFKCEIEQHRSARKGTHIRLPIDQPVVPQKKPVRTKAYRDISRSIGLIQREPLSRLHVEVSSKEISTQLHNQYLAECHKCKGSFQMEQLKEFNAKLFCAECFNKLTVSGVCMLCKGEANVASHTLVKSGAYLFHMDCLKCSECEMAFEDGNGELFRVHKGRTFCEKHFTVEVICYGCGLSIGAAGVSTAGRNWHSDCLVCMNCRNPLTGNYYERNGHGICKSCAYNLGKPHPNTLCAGCERVIGKGSSIKALGCVWHVSCFTCVECSVSLDDGFYHYKGKPFCRVHAPMQ